MLFLCSFVFLLQQIVRGNYKQIEFTVDDSVIAGLVVYLEVVHFFMARFLSEIVHHLSGLS